MLDTSPIEASEFVDMEQMDADVKIDVTNLGLEVQQHASLYVMYASKAVRARRQHERLKTMLVVLEAQLDNQYRTTLKEENPKTTEGQIRAAVVTDARWRAASGKIIDAQQFQSLAEIGVRGFDQRKDMLLQLARDAARERDGGLRVMTSASIAASTSASVDLMAESMERTMERRKEAEKAA